MKSLSSRRRLPCVGKDLSSAVVFLSDRKMPCEMGEAPFRPSLVSWVISLFGGMDEIGPVTSPDRWAVMLIPTDNARQWNKTGEGEN